MTEPERVPLYVRLPRAQADALDRAVRATGVRKGHLVTRMISEALPMGRIDITDNAPPPEALVLTVDEAAAVLRVPAGEVLARLEAGDLPGRRLGGDWRISRPALLAWLAAGEGPTRDAS
ncbi:MAG: helix-turn-helix domain-containing protein [Thermoleophilia bacterium]|nr:helix-turn-helix domain-containing protein [Thermoleophilia bacterium]